MIKYGYSNFSLEILEYCDIYVLLKREQDYLDSLKPIYNTEKIAGSTLGAPKSKETKEKISKALKGVYTGENSSLYGISHTEETKLLMSKSRQGENNAMYGKTHSEQTKTLMRLARTGKVVDANTKEKMSKAKGTAVYLYAACLGDSTEKFCLIKIFTSIRQAGKYLEISAGTVSRYMKLN